MTTKTNIVVSKRKIRHTLEVRQKKLTKVLSGRKSTGIIIALSTGYFRSNYPQLMKSGGTAFVNVIISVPDNDLMSPYTVIGEVNGFKMPIFRDSGTTVDIVSRNRIKTKMATEVELKGKFGQLRTKAAVVCSEADKEKYLLGNRTAALPEKDRERLLFPKIYALQTRAQKRVA
ncbi:hypothetical protein AVEN_39343-1 [Araneus ventricosus]|uniref:Uncharacterized protein n=1 Tax=Araneus ventricosus TaxID=182803 RepID=A0A4Y2UPM0_ARAVE|nr:hypothetical protein AVEN_39343-1 [Araneus ventricosus]